MKDKNGIRICCKNCECYNGKFCEAKETYPECNKGGYFNPTTDAYEARIAELQEREQSHLEDFTIEEIDFLKKAISLAIFDCETNPPKPSDENLKLMWSIKSKCDAILKANVRENRTLKESGEK